MEDHKLFALDALTQDATDEARTHALLYIGDAQDATPTPPRSGR